MKNHKLIFSVVLASIFFTPTLAVAEDKGPESRAEEFIKDSAITTQIKAKLLAVEDIDSLHIKVDTDNNGVVVLTGTVKTEAEKDKVNSIAQSVDGVKNVLNALEISPNR
jgi:hyperosmotically inducible protein